MPSIDEFINLNNKKRISFRSNGRHATEKSFVRRGNIDQSELRANNSPVLGTATIAGGAGHIVCSIRIACSFVKCVLSV